MVKVYTNNKDEYKGRYVAIKSFTDHTIVGAGLEPQTAIKKAAEKGVKDPVLVYIPYDFPRT
jgi:hypothetical protein